MKDVLATIITMIGIVLALIVCGLLVAIADFL
jgi:hypothetical protein